MKMPRLARSATGTAWLALATFCASAATGADTSASTKDHSLFVGQDVSVLVDGDYRPVVGAGRRSFLVRIGDKVREIYTNRAKAVRVSRGMKLSTMSVAITGIAASTSSDADAAEQAQSMQTAMALQSAAEDKRDFLQGQEIRAELEASFADVFVAPGTPPLAKQQARADVRLAAVAQAQQNYMPKLFDGQAAIDQSTYVGSDALRAGLAGSANSGDGVELLPVVTDRGVRLSISGGGAGTGTRIAITGDAKSNALAEATTAAQIEMPPTAVPAQIVERPAIHDFGNGRSDRLDLDFQLSAPQTIDGAFLTVTTEYVTPGSSEVFRRVLAQKVGTIGHSPRRIRIYETDYPTGFHITNYSINLYAHGQEIATNLSPSRLELTQEEAYQYVVADYLASHQGETHPPAAVLMAPRSELNSYQPPSALATPVYVSVSRDGKVEAVSSDPSQTTGVNPTVRAALEKFRFIPALDKGVPVAGRAKLVVAEFTR